MVLAKMMEIEIISQSMTGNLLYNFLLEETSYKFCLKNINQFIKETPSSNKQDTILLVDITLPDVQLYLKQECCEKTILSKYFSAAAFNLKKESNHELLAVHSGFKGIFYEDENLEEFIREIEYIANGGIRLPKKLMFEALHSGALDHKEEVVNQTIDEKKIRLSGLTRREVEILQLIHHGATNQEIADKLFISIFTVKKHLSNIYQKTDRGNRNEAAMWFMNL